MMPTQITDRKSPLLTDLKKFLAGTAEISVGVHDAEGSRSHDAESGLTIVEIAEKHEFGLGVPQRSFLRAWFDETKDEIHATLKNELLRALDRGESFEWTAERVALWCQASIQRRIRNRIPPPLHPATIAEKSERSAGEKDVPLIDTGVLRASILAYLNQRPVT